jgi:hypothetical protein
MGPELGTVVEQRVVTMATRERSRDRWFFSGMAIAALLTVFAGFSKTYYLGRFFGAEPISTLVHTHGVVFTLWILLFVGQTSLIAARRTVIHRRLGAVGAALAVLMLVVGYLTAIEAARLGVTPPGGPPPLNFLSVPLGTLLAFGILVAAGIHNRGRSETHKRLMLLATIALLTPALARFRNLDLPGGPPMAIGGTCLFVLACMGYDRGAHGKVHPAFLWGGLFLMISLPLRFAIGRTDAWRSIAVWLTS